MGLLASPEWRRLPAADVAARLEAGALALWPIGSTEQHGRHLVTGFDHMVAEAVVVAAAAELGDSALILPTLQFGASEHWLPLGGTLTLTAETLRRVLKEVAQSLAKAGGRRLMIVNGHSSNLGPGIMAAGELAESSAIVEFVCYWDLIDRDVLDEHRQADHGIGHAGELETSIGLHLDELVRADQIPTKGTALDPNAPGGSELRVHRAISLPEDAKGGVIGNPAAATIALGQAAFESAVQGLVAHCRIALDGAFGLRQEVTSADDVGQR
jgi:creatinine amidohydrolase